MKMIAMRTLKTQRVIAEQGSRFRKWQSAEKTSGQNNLFSQRSEK